MVSSTSPSPAICSATPSPTPFCGWPKPTLARGTTFALADMHQVRFLNSSGLSILISLLTRFRNAGGELLLVEPSPELRKLLVITRLEAIFTLASSVEAAENQLRALAT